MSKTWTNEDTLRLQALLKRAAEECGLRAASAAAMGRRETADAWREDFLRFDAAYRAAEEF